MDITKHLAPINKYGLNYTKVVDVTQYFTFKNIKKVVAIYAAAKLVKWVANYFYKLWYFRKIPGRPGMLPFIGNVHQLRKDKSELFYEIIRISNVFKHSPIFRFWFTTQIFINAHRPEAVEPIFDNSVPTSKEAEYEMLLPWLGTGLLTSNGDKWFSRRKMITPTFHFDILKDFLSVFNEQAEIFMQKLHAIEENKKIYLFPYIAACTLDIICETAMGQHVNAQNDKNSAYVNAIHEICDTLLERHHQPWLRPNFIFKLSKFGRRQAAALKILHGFTRKVIKERKEHFEGLFSTNKRRIAFMDVLLDAQLKDPVAMNDDGIQEEVDTFMFEGHDTTTTALYFTTYLIATHPDVQAKLHKEIDEIFSTSNRHITNDDLNRLTYLELVIKESLRLYPPVPFIMRNLTNDSTIGGHKLLKGTLIILQIFAINRNEEHFPEPNNFKPERFELENSMNRHPYCYIPFSAGKRNCIGQKFAMMEMKIILSYILRNFELCCNQTEKELKLYFDLLLRTENEIKISLKSRNKI